LASAGGYHLRRPLLTKDNIIFAADPVGQRFAVGLAAALANIAAVIRK